LTSRFLITHRFRGKEQYSQTTVFAAKSSNYQWPTKDTVKTLDSFAVDVKITRFLSPRSVCQTTRFRNRRTVQLVTFLLCTFKDSFTSCEDFSWKTKFSKLDANFERT